MSGYNPKTGVWQSSVNSSASTVVVGVNVDSDEPGEAGNRVPVTYISGPATSKIVFPEQYSTLTAMSICSVTRYTSTLAQFRQRIFQPYKANINW
jgi:hypothetical protein